MSGPDNIKTIRSVYEAFVRGDVDFVLAQLGDEVDWASDTTSRVAPWYGVRRSKSEVADFFTAFGSTMEVEEFTPLAYAADGDEVHTIVHMRAKARANGNVAEFDLHHFFRMADGKIVYYRGTEDTPQIEQALA